MLGVTRIIHAKCANRGRKVQCRINCDAPSRCGADKRCGDKAVSHHQPQIIHIHDDRGMKRCQRGNSVTRLLHLVPQSRNNLLCLPNYSSNTIYTSIFFLFFFISTRGRGSLTRDEKPAIWCLDLSPRHMQFALICHCRNCPAGYLPARLCQVYGSSSPSCMKPGNKQSSLSQWMGDMNPRVPGSPLGSCK